MTPLTGWLPTWIKELLLVGMDEQINYQMRQYCISWDKGCLPLVQDHPFWAQTENVKEQKTTAEQNSTEWQAPAGTAPISRGGPPRSRDQAPSRETCSAGPQDDGCCNCGDTGHWVRGCPKSRRKRRPTGPQQCGTNKLVTVTVTQLRVQRGWCGRGRGDSRVLINGPILPHTHTHTNTDTKKCFM